MNKNEKKPTIDGRPGLLAFAREYHPRKEHTIVDVEKLLRRIGFEVTDVNEDRIIIAGPLRTTTACRTLVLYGGSMRIRHLEIVKALLRLTETGPPVWASEDRQLAWFSQQLEACEPFQVTALEEFETRADLEAHVEKCHQCRPSYQALSEAVSRGSSRHGDQHLRELIEKSHVDPEAARKFYETVRDNQAGSLYASSAKSGRTRNEVMA